MTSYKLVFRDPCGGTIRLRETLDQIMRENTADAADIEATLAVGKNFRVSSSRGESLTVYAN
jgi:hypothetical protein